MAGYLGDSTAQLDTAEDSAEDRAVTDAAEAYVAPLDHPNLR